MLNRVLNATLLLILPFIVFKIARERVFNFLTVKGIKKFFNTLSESILNHYESLLNRGIPLDNLGQLLYPIKS